MTQKFTPQLTTTDWNEEWKQLQRVRRHMDDASYWDKRSKTYTTKDSPNSYVDQFLAFAQIKPDETVFDMGCGTGALSIPLAERGHTVLAADFSRGMLERMREELDKRGLTSVTSKVMSWEDPWEEFDIGSNTVDVALASRSIATDDLRESLLKLTSVARKRACITLSTGSSPRVNDRILTDIGIADTLGRDYLYAFNILVHEGYKPEVAYIESARRETFASFDDAFETYSQMVRNATLNHSNVDLDALFKKLTTWLHDHLIENPQNNQADKKGIPEKRFCLDAPQQITWAFIRWNTSS